tara:strand:- start:873 stop:1535 length:663 start_codon:yes stop_codon:yes gene_type:complete
MIDFNISRKNMILNQLKVNNITEENILKAIESIPREIFLPSHLKSRAYLDEDTEIFANRFLLEPKILGYILKLSKIQITDVVLDLACSTGYTSAILSKLAKKVYGIDQNKSLLKKAFENTSSLKINNTSFIYSNPKNGLKTKNKFDSIFIFGGVEFISNKVLDLLKSDGGKLITVFYHSDMVGKIGIIKKIKGKLYKKYYYDSNTPILNDFRKNRKEFIF